MLAIFFLTILLISRANSQSPSISVVSDFIDHPDTTTNGELHLGDYRNLIYRTNDLPLTDSVLNANDSSAPIKDRQKRFIYKNVYGTFDVGFLIIIPYIIILPPFSNFFNKWRNKRSITAAANMLQNESESDIYSEEDPFIQQYLDRITSHFELIQIFEPACQQRAICEFSADPAKYFPIADLVLANLRSVPTEYLQFVQNSKNLTSIKTEGPKPVSLFKMHTMAEEYGLLHGHQHCHTKFAEKCFYSTDQRLDMSTLKFWKLLESLISLKVEHKE